VVGARESKVGKTKLLDAAKARHLGGVDNKLLKFSKVNTTIDGIDDEGHYRLYGVDEVLK
jgi:hypothetical protein